MRSQYSNIFPISKFMSFAAKSLQSCPTLCDPIDGSPPDSPFPGILQARILEWVAISFPMHERKSDSEVVQSCPTLSDPMDCSLLGSSVHGIFQTRVLEWVAIAFSHDEQNCIFVPVMSKTASLCICFSISVG